MVYKQNNSDLFFYKQQAFFIGSRSKSSLVFSRQIFDRRNFGTISPKDIYNVLRSLGKNITLDESKSTKDVLGGCFVVVCSLNLLK